MSPTVYNALASSLLHTCEALPFFHLETTGGPGGGPADSFSVTPQGLAVLLASQALMERAHVPPALVGPTLGGSFALADALTGSPSAPMNGFLKSSFASMGLATTVQSAWSYGFDAFGARWGTPENAILSTGATLATFIPAIEGGANPFFSRAFAQALNSAVGVGLAGGSEGALVFLADGWTGEAGWAGGGAQAMGAVGAVLMGSQLGGWIVDHAVGIDDRQDPYGQLAGLARDRAYSDLWGGIGRSPLGHAAAGMTVLLGGGDGLNGELEAAKRTLLRESRDFVRRMDANVIPFLLQAASGEWQGSMEFTALERGVRRFYQRNEVEMTAHYRVFNVLRRTYQVSENDAGMTRFVSEDGRILDREGFSHFAATAAREAIGRRVQDIRQSYERYGLTMSDAGLAVSRDGHALNAEQIRFIDGEGRRLAEEVVRLSNALTALESE